MNDLEGHSRLSEVVRFDKPYITFSQNASNMIFTQKCQQTNEE